MAESTKTMASFEEIKKTFVIETILTERFGVKLTRINNSTVRGRCPLPSHPENDSNTRSLSVNVNKQVWVCHNNRCQAERNNRKGGDLIQFVAEYNQSSLREAGIWFLPLLEEIPSESSSKSFSDKGEVKVPEEGSGPYQAHSRPRNHQDILTSLSDWIEKRKSMTDEPMERSAYEAVLGRIKNII